MSVDRRTLLLGLAGAAVSGCAAPGSAVFQVLESYRALDRAKKVYPVPRADIDNQPLGVMGVQVEGGLKGIIVWQRRENGLDYWQSGNGVIMITQRGRLVRTSGFAQDLIASRVIAGVEPWGSKLDAARSYEVDRELDYRPDQYGVAARYQMTYVRDREIELMGTRHTVSEWSEQVRLPSLRRKWTQLVQVDRETGEVLRSIQHIGPKLRVVLELLKPPAPQAN